MPIKVGAIKRIAVLLMGGIFLFGSTQASAQSIYSQLDTPFYDPSSGEVCGPSGDGDLSGNSNIEKAFNFYVSQGLTKEQSAGIVGNMVHESGVDPENIQNPGGRTKNPDEAGGSGWGIVQWTPATKATDIHRESKQTGPVYELEVQLAMVWAQLTGMAGGFSEKQAGDDLKQTTTLLDAVLAFQGTDQGGPYKYYFGFERPADKVGSVAKRLGHAKSIIRLYGGGVVEADSTSETEVDCSCSVTGTQANSLQKTVEQAAEKNGGRTAIAVASKDGGKSAGVSGDIQMPTRSSYKLYTAYATLRAIDEGKISWSTKVWNNKSVDEAMKEMIIKSDNDAAEALRTNKLIGSHEYVTKLLQNDLGLSDKTVMGSGKADDAKGSNSQSTANDFVKFLSQLEKRKLAGVSKDSSYDKLLSYMKQATTDGGSARAGIAAGVGKDVEVADKPGWAPAGPAPASNDVGIVYGPNETYVVAILTDKPSQWDGIAEIAKTVHAVMSSRASSQATQDCQGGVQGDLGATVMNYAWPEYHPPPYLKRKPAYASAISRVIKNGLYAGGTVGGVPGIDCGAFVTHLLIDSGFEPRYNSNGRGGNTISQIAWLESNWQQINPRSTKDHQPGDVAINTKHTYVYVGKIDGFNSLTASASYSEAGNGRAPMAGHEVPADSSFMWYRKK